MKKTVPFLVAIVFAFGAASTFAAKHMSGEKMPTAEECKKDPKMAGCEKMKKK